MGIAAINPKNIKNILPKRKDKPFSSVSVYPADLEFDVQNPGEIIYIMMRKHFFTNFPWVWRAIVVILLPLLLILVVNNLTLEGRKFLLEDIVSKVSSTFWLLALLAFYSGVTTYIIGNFLNWYFNIYLVTNERIIHIHFKIFTGKMVSEASLEKIEDISQQIYGFFPSIFNYGDVYVQTAAEKARFLFKSVSDPSWFRDVLGDLVSLIKAGEP